MGVENERGAFLVGLVSRYAVPLSSILEIGCKGGKNLDPLYRAGFTELTGLEESADRVRQIESNFPALWERIRIILGPPGKSALEFADGEFDLVFSVGYFEEEADHELLFDEMARLTGRYLIAIEDERDLPGRSAPRNYREIFEKRGLEQVEEIDVSREPEIQSVFFARVLERTRRMDSEV